MCSAVGLYPDEAPASSYPLASSSSAFASAPWAKVSRMRSREKSRSSSYASRNSCSSLLVAAAFSLLWNFAPRRHRNASSMRNCASSGPRQRRNATIESTSMSSSTVRLPLPTPPPPPATPSSRHAANKASTASTAPSWTQTHRGNRRVLAPCSTGRKASSIKCRRGASDNVFASSKMSGMKATGPRQNSTTAGTFRCCSAASNGVLASSISAFTSALASIKIAAAERSDASVARQFIAKRLKHVCPARPAASASSLSPPSRTFALAPKDKASRTKSTSISRSSSHAWRNSCNNRCDAAPSDSSRNRVSPACSFNSSAIRRRASSLPRLLWSATSTSSVISSSCAALRKSASTAGGLPACTQIHKGSFMFGSPSTCGRKMSSMVVRHRVLEIDFNSSKASLETLAPASHRADTATMCRDCTASTRGEASGTKPSVAGSLMLARAFTRASTMVRTLDSGAFRLIAMRPKAVCGSKASSSSLTSSTNELSSLLLSSSSPCHSHSRPQTQ
mmetsp:Transcript_119020/g.341972  ORF Transcript_119020/g.341972 Transcript_119020/m.341972 type:complete len:507 (-) Transcript_119020:1045-2565(-)